MDDNQGTDVATHEVTSLLLRWRGGDNEALNDELRCLARQSQNRSQFFGLAAGLIRRTLVDRALMQDFFQSGSA
jgi:hypothetical protein